MKFLAEINIMPLKTLLDPQGKAVSSSMKNINLEEISNVRIGKHITLEVEAENENVAVKKLKLLVKKYFAIKLWNILILVLKNYNYYLRNSKLLPRYTFLTCLSFASSLAVPDFSILPSNKICSISYRKCLVYIMISN